jgi:ketosteroid isomerase-like protein
MKLYVPDDSLFVFDVEPPRQHLGAADYRKDWADTFAEFKGAPLVTISDVAVTAVGPIGYGHSIQHVSGTDRNGKPIDFTVRVTDVYRKIKGAWLIVQEHVSVPVTLATGKADINSKP